MKELDHPEGAYRTPDRDRAREKQLLAAFDAEIARQRTHDRQRVRRARYAGLIVSGTCAALFAVAMAENLVKEGLTANGLRPLLACATVVVVLALLVRRAGLVLRHRADLSRQKQETDVLESVAEQIRTAKQERARNATSAPPVEPAPADPIRDSTVLVEDSGITAPR
jgi:hypothetical protein